MSNKSRNGVFYDLNESDYRYVTSMYTLVFSSKSHMEKFVKTHGQYSNKIGSIIFTRLKVHFSDNILSDILCYKSIESRGFLVIINGYKCTSIDEIEFVNGCIMKKISEV